MGEGRRREREIKKNMIKREKGYGALPGDFADGSRHGGEKGAF